MNHASLNMTKMKRHRVKPIISLFKIKLKINYILSNLRVINASHRVIIVYKTKVQESQSCKTWTDDGMHPCHVFMKASDYENYQ